MTFSFSPVSVLVVSPKNGAGLSLLLRVPIGGAGLQSPFFIFWLLASMPAVPRACPTTDLSVGNQATSKRGVDYVPIGASHALSRPARRSSNLAKLTASLCVQRNPLTFPVARSTMW